MAKYWNSRSGFVHKSRTKSLVSPEFNFSFNNSLQTLLLTGLLRPKNSNLSLRYFFMGWLFLWSAFLCSSRATFSTKVFTSFPAVWSTSSTFPRFFNDPVLDEALLLLIAVKLCLWKVANKHKSITLRSSYLTKQILLCISLLIPPFRKSHDSWCISHAITLDTSWDIFEVRFVQRMAHWHYNFLVATERWIADWLNEYVVCLPKVIFEDAIFCKKSKPRIYLRAR